MCVHRTRLVLCAFLVFSVFPTLKQSALAQQIAPAAPAVEAATAVAQFTTAVDVSAKQQWTDTGILLASGDHVRVVATGTVRRPAARACGPDGVLRSWRELLLRFPVNSGGMGSLVGRVGLGDVMPAFEIGTRRDIKVKSSGRLYLGINEAPNEISTGGFHAMIVVTRRPGASPMTIADSSGMSAPKQVPASEFPSPVLAKIPRRIGDSSGNPGDMINFLIVGPEDEVVRTFEQAGWVRVEIMAKQSLWQTAVNSFLKRPYTKMPMSQLYLFGRTQDYGFAHAKPVSVVSTRHHLRIWRTPYEVNGQPLWAGAATHDMGFVRDIGKWKITHYIDPNVDDERAYVEETLGETGSVTQWALVQPSNPVENARTATGEPFNSTGDVLVVWLREDEEEQKDPTSEADCRVPEQIPGVAESLLPCGEYPRSASGDSEQTNPAR
ncbi:MAG TPA: LssY C-terminal domain-containing protein [Methylomirabilota bacterium]|nr:LssY C-terminal domain-containing protein [Methylomirabilota bacterium]